jgi:antitoxin component YwqK of YwqJK toxin-antitoxin module
MKLAIIRLGVAVLMATQTGAARVPEHRTVVERWPSGRVRRESTYVDDVLDGPSRGWYEDGAPQFAYVYRHGLSEGEQRQWYPSGQIFTWFHDHLGHEVGRQRMWNPDGTIRSNYVIKDGKRFGLVGALGCTGKEM